MYNSSFTDNNPRPTPSHDPSRPRLVKVVNKTRPRPVKIVYRPKTPAPKRPRTPPATPAQKVGLLTARRSRYILLRPGTAIVAQLTLIVTVLAGMVSII